MYTAATLTTLFAAALAAPQKLSARQTGYQSYRGDGSLAAQWPDTSRWVTFDALWSAYTDIITNACQEYQVSPGVQVTANSPDEIQQLRNAILSVAGDSGVPDVFILATVLQESRGCVRVWETANGFRNPGLMQSFNGQGTCNTAQAQGGVITVPGQETVPCPEATIRQMIVDGTQGNSATDNSLRFDIDRANGIPSEPAQAIYRASRYYNSGSIVNGDTGDLSDPASVGTVSYSSDIANRLLGVVFTGTLFQ